MATDRPPPVEASSPLFSAVPHAEKNMLVFYAIAGLYAVLAVLFLVAMNVDHADAKRRAKRGVVPDSSIPSLLAESYFMNEEFRRLRRATVNERKQRMGGLALVFRYLERVPGAMSREHVLLSFFVRAMPTFSRVKRCIILTMQIHCFMLCATAMFNVLEHARPDGIYEPLLCTVAAEQGRWDARESQALFSDNPPCASSMLLSLLASFALYPFIRFFIVHQVRLLCFVHQGHNDEESEFPCTVRKFAQIQPKTLRESLFAMRNSHEEKTQRLLAERTIVHRFVGALHTTTFDPLQQSMRFYSMEASALIAGMLLLFFFFAAGYTIGFAANFSEQTMFHWLASVVVMFVVSTLFIEPCAIFCYHVFWCSFVHALSQNFGYGPYALSATLQYKDAIRQIDKFFFQVLRVLGAVRVQRWWRAVLSMYRAIHEQTVSAIKIQSMRKKQIARKKYASARKWCLSIEIQRGEGLPLVEIGGTMNPYVKILPDDGNPRPLETKVCWSGNANPKIFEKFLVDVKDVSRICIEAWTREIHHDEFIGRAVIDTKSPSAPSGHVSLPLYDTQLGSEPRPGSKPLGHLWVGLHYLDPLAMGESADTSWMLPRHRMQFVMSRVGGNLTIGKMLGAFGKYRDEVMANEPPGEGLIEGVSLTADAGAPAGDGTLPGQVD